MSGPLLTSLRLTFFPSRHPCIFGSDRARGANPAGRSRFCTVLSAQKPKTPGGGSRSGQPRKSSEASMLQLLLFGCIVFPLIALSL